MTAAAAPRLGPPPAPAVVVVCECCAQQPGVVSVAWPDTTFMVCIGCAPQPAAAAAAVRAS